MIVRKRPRFLIRLKFTLQVVRANDDVCMKENYPTKLSIGSMSIWIKIDEVVLEAT